MTLIRLFSACFMLAVTGHGAVAENWVVDRIAQPAEYSLDWIPDEIEPDGTTPDESGILLVAAASDSVEWLVLEPGMTLPNGSWVRTGESGRLLLRRGEETIQFKPDTTAAITSWEHEGATLTDVEQRIGSVLLEVETRETKHTVVETPLLAAVVKGTGFTVNYDGERASVLVGHGVVEVVDRLRNESVDVRAEQRVEVSRSRPGSMTVQGLGPKGIVSRIAFSSVETQQEAQPRHVRDETQIAGGTEDRAESAAPMSPAAPAVSDSGPILQQKAQPRPVKDETQIAGGTEDPVEPSAPVSPAAPTVSENGPILQQATALEDRRIARRAAMQEERRAARIGTRILERQTIRQAERQTDRIDERQAGRREERRAKRVEERRTERIAERRAQRVEERRADRVEERRAERVEERRAERVEERRAERVEERRAERVVERQAEDVTEQQVDPLEEQQVDVAEDRRAARVEERQAERILKRRAQRQAERAQDGEPDEADPLAQGVPEDASIPIEEVSPDGDPDNASRGDASGVADSAAAGVSGPVPGDDVAPPQSEIDDVDDRSPAAGNLPTLVVDETGSDGLTPEDRRAQRVAERQAERQAERSKQAATERAAGRMEAGDTAADTSSIASVSTNMVEPDEGPAIIPTRLEDDPEIAIDIDSPKSGAVASGDLPAAPIIVDTPSTDGGGFPKAASQTPAGAAAETMPAQVSEDVVVIPTSDLIAGTVDHEGPVAGKGQDRSDTDAMGSTEMEPSRPASGDAQATPVEPDGASATPSPADGPAERSATTAEMRAAARQAERIAARQAEHAAARQAERDARIAEERHEERGIFPEEAIDTGSHVEDDGVGSDAPNGSAEGESDETRHAIATPAPSLLNDGGDGIPDGSDLLAGQHRGSNSSTLLPPDPGPGILEEMLDLVVGTGAFPNPDDGSNGTGASGAIRETGPFSLIGRPDRDYILVPTSQAADLAPVPIPASALLLITALIGALALGSARQSRHR